VKKEKREKRQPSGKEVTEGYTYEGKNLKYQRQTRSIGEVYI